ncbi:GH12 family glycosyl hydrolase domain-containing protein [Actinocorallia lasiicapitis]
MQRLVGMITGSVLAGLLLPPVAAYADEERCDTAEPGFVDGGYAVQANRWNSHGSLCVRFGKAPGFTVTGSTLNRGNLANGFPPGAYPNIGTALADRRLPRGMDAPIRTSWAFTGAAGAYNASYDLWYHPDPAACTSTSPYIVANGGALEIMIWFSSPGIDPSPEWKIADGVTVGGRVYDLYKFTGPTGQTGLIYDLRAETTSVDGLELVPFARDAADRGFQTPEANLCKVQAGFEITEGGQGLAITNFALDEGSAPAPSPTASTPPAPTSAKGTSAWWALPIAALTAAAGVLLWRRRR